MTAVRMNVARRSIAILSTLAFVGGFCGCSKGSDGAQAPKDSPERIESDSDATLGKPPADLKNQHANTGRVRSGENPSAECLGRQAGSPPAAVLVSEAKSEPAKASHGEAESEGPAHPTFEQAVLDLKVVPEAGAGNAAENSNALPVQMTAGENEIQIHTKLGLRDLSSQDERLRRDWFFSWPDVFRGRAILSARYSSRVQETQRGTLLGTATLNARPDRGAGRMLIPFSEIFANFVDYQEASASAEHQQVLDLEMSLQGGESARVRILFQVVGALPSPRMSSVPVGDLKPREKARQAWDSGLELVKETVENPVDRPMRVWLRASQKALSLWHGLSQATYSLHPELGPQRGGDRIRGSLGWLWVKQVEIKRAKGESERVDLDQDGVGFFDLEAREQVEMAWKALRVTNSAQCQIPSLVNQSFTWLVISEEVPRQREVYRKQIASLTMASARAKGELTAKAEEILSMIPKVLKHQQVKVEWDLTSAELEGDWRREIRIAHPYIGKDQALGGETLSPEKVGNAIQNFREVRNKTQKFRLSDGFDRDVLKPENRFECQGLFP